MSEDMGGRTRKERQATRRYAIELGTGSIAFLALFLFLPELVPTEQGSVSSVAVALLPLVPVLWMIIAVARHIGRMDEFQRVLITQSFAIGFAAAMLIALTIAFLSGAGILVPYPEWFVFIGGMAVWSLALWVLFGRAGR